MLFGAGPVTLLSGTQVSTAVGLWRLLLVCGYLVVCLAAFGAIGLFISTLTEQPIGATIGVVGLAIISQILDSLTQLSAIHEYLPTHYWLAFGDLLRDPIATDQITPGIDQRRRLHRDLPDRGVGEVRQQGHHQLTVIRA